MIKPAKCVLTGSGCFVSGTSVRMADGSTRQIEWAKAGAEAASRDSHTGKTDARRVSAPIAKHAELVTLTLADKSGKVVDAITANRGYLSRPGAPCAPDATYACDFGMRRLEISRPVTLRIRVALTERDIVAEQQRLGCQDHLMCSLTSVAASFGLAA